MSEGSLPVKKPARRGYSITYKNKTLLSTVDPIAQAERAVAELKKPGRTLYFCPSPLLGYGLDSLLSLSGEDSAILCVETDKALFDLSLSSINKNSEKILNHPRFALTDLTGAELCSFVREKWGARVFRRLEVVKLSGGWQLDTTGYEKLAELLRRDIALEWSNAMTLVKLGRRFVWNALRNLAVLSRSRPITELSFGSKPVLVLGAGPSLDPVLDGLQNAGLFNRSGEHKSRRPFTLICVDTCITILRERGIIPDLTVILESQFWNQRDFIGARNKRIPAALDLSAYPSTVEILGGPVFFFFTPWTPLRLFERISAAGLLPPTLPPLGSVGLTAVELARRLSSGPVITAGIDFSFTIDQMHARSSPAHLSALAVQNRFSSLINGAAVFRQGVFNTRSKSNIPVKSDPAMRTYRNLFEQEFADDRRIIDIAGTGLSLGVKTLGIKETAALLGSGPQEYREASTGSKRPASASALIRGEISTLETLRNILTGSVPAQQDRLETLLDEADYLWAHFPDCAGAEGRRPPASDLVFLKQVRAEIDPFLKIWQLAERESAQR
jgi:hypothetical protein